MEETPSKRPREESREAEEIEETKRFKSYNHILSLLEEEEDEPAEDLSYLITTLQQELSPENPLSSSSSSPSSENEAATVTSFDYSASLLKEEYEEDDDKEKVIRHLLEASDDELGIPNREEVVGDVDKGGSWVNNGGLDDGFTNLCDGLWEIEDANANYYTLLQSNLFSM